MLLLLLFHIVLQIANNIAMLFLIGAIIAIIAISYRVANSKYSMLFLIWSIIAIIAIIMFHNLLCC